MGFGKALRTPEENRLYLREYRRNWQRRKRKQVKEDYYAGRIAFEDIPKNLQLEFPNKILRKHGLLPEKPRKLKIKTSRSRGKKIKIKKIRVINPLRVPQKYVQNSVGRKRYLNSIKKCGRCEILLSSKHAGKHNTEHCESCIKILHDKSSNS